MHNLGPFSLLVIGGSAGALLPVLDLVSLLRYPSSLSVILVLHRKASDVDTLVELLASRTSFDVKDIDDKDSLRPGWIFVAPPDYHVLLEKDLTLSLDDSEKINFSRPSIDVTFESAATVLGGKVACLLLSGANADGVAGLVVAKSKGAFIAVQDPAESEFPVMPQQALAQVSVDMLVNQHTMRALSDLLP